MAIDPHSLFIRTYPDPSLRRKALPLESITDEVRTSAARMLDLMREAEGIGLAAPQVGLPWRLFVAHLRPHPDDLIDSNIDALLALPEPTVYINPTLTEYAGDLETAEEGCLSLPDIRGDVRRPPIVTIEALDLEGRPFRQRAVGLLSRCWQHECDHLDGMLIIDRMTPMARLKNRSKIRELERDRTS